MIIDIFALGASMLEVLKKPPDFLPGNKAASLTVEKIKKSSSHREFKNII